MKSWIEIADMYAEAAEAYKRATGVSCVKDPARWQATVGEGRRLEALADKAAEERRASFPD